MRWKFMRYRSAMPVPGIRGAFHSCWWRKRAALWQNDRRTGSTRFLRLFVSSMEARAQRCTSDGQWSGFDGSRFFSQLHIKTTLKYLTAPISCALLVIFKLHWSSFLRELWAFRPRVFKICRKNQIPHRLVYVRPLNSQGQSRSRKVASTSHVEFIKFDEKTTRKGL